ncbi:hypothetical protein [Fimbriimonas ginsengisoli]|uniref:Glycine zipper 2TM domain-containing protein n=1 Tax=Fimbriimonas ginsengisoli Gsoil 348 TaxID=661478 RepID=A0A068NPS4_FIMGI|nr:hypothetical protein [Fimbriimonas ginsengisoli]AIE84765.1 hypothetical protein OP10G_1397 [Fimbriimonas ginsengisoli Gsoil 348]
MSTLTVKIASAVLAASVVALPVMAPAQSSAYRHRQQTKNTWRNLGYAGGALGVYGLLTHNNTLAIGGLAGGAYSAWRYEQDRKSQNAMRGRALRYWRWHHRHHHR